MPKAPLPESFYDEYDKEKFNVLLMRSMLSQNRKRNWLSYQDDVVVEIAQNMEANGDTTQTIASKLGVPLEKVNNLLVNYRKNV